MTSTTTCASFSRADFLRGGGALVVALGLPASAWAATGAATAADDAQAFPAVDPSSLDSWLAVHPDGTVTAFTGKVELGAGNRTALSQIIAEELDISFDSVHLIVGDTARCVDQGITADSNCIRSGGPQVRQAAANGRQALVSLAATHLGVPASDLAVSNGVVSVVGNPSRKVSYGELVGGQLLATTMPITEQAPGGAGGAFTLGGATPKSPRDYTIVGTPVPRIDIPGKITGGWVYVQDVHVPGMLHGRVIRPPGLGSQLISVGTPPAGVQVVRLNNFLGVVAEREWDAIQAQKTLKVRWSDWEGLPAEGNLYSYILGTRSTDRVISSVGNAQAALGSAEHVLTARYSTPIQTHGTLGPSCAVADVKDGSALIYSGTQQPNGVQKSVADALQIPLENVRVITYDASGCYGRNSSDPATIDAALMSQLAGRPVRLQWMRWDDHGWDPKGPATVHLLRGGVDAKGDIVGWDHQAWIPKWFETTVIGSVLAGRTTRLPGFDLWDGPMLYNLPASRQFAHFQGDIGSEANNGVGLISAWLRSPVQTQLTFAMESFFDELAATVGIDPIQLRLRYLQAGDPRVVEVLKAAAKAANWQTRPSPGPDARSTSEIARGRGVAISTRTGSFNAEVAEVEVNRKTGKIRVTRIIAVQDNGLTINPRAVKLGIEAGVVQTVSRTLIEQINFNRSNVTSLDWATYPIIRFTDAPPVEVIILNHPEMPAAGSGEPSVNPVAPAIGNAVFDATGVRLRGMPMRPPIVREALALGA
jgi:CO/xanthine dehydrogenase Mo-binding subunit